MSDPLNILTGMILGDACLVLGKTSRNALLRLQHSPAQREYLLHKVSILQQFTSVNVREVENDGYGHATVVAETKSHPLYTRLHDRWYINRRKSVTLDVLQHLDEVGLAYWFMDDGSLTRHYRHLRNGGLSISGREIHFHTQSFSYDENVLMRDYIQYRFGVNMRVSTHKKIYYVLGCGSIEGQKLFKIISPYVLPLFNYKLDMKFVDDLR